MELMKFADFQKNKNRGEYFVMFYTTWCSDSKQMLPVIEKIEGVVNAEFPKIKFVLIDAEEANIYQTRGEYEVLKVPSFFYIRDGISLHIGYEYFTEGLLTNKIRLLIKGKLVDKTNA